MQDIFFSNRGVKTSTVVGDLCDALKAGMRIDVENIGFSVRDYTEVNDAVSRLGAGNIIDLIIYLWKLKLNHF